MPASISWSWTHRPNDMRSSACLLRPRPAAWWDLFCRRFDLASSFRVQSLRSTLQNDQLPRSSLDLSDEEIELRYRVVEAVQRKDISFGFSAGGCLFPYYIGVAGGLQNAGIMRSETKLGGASAGSLIAACVKSGMASEELTELTLRLMHDCRRNGTRGRLGPVLRKFLEKNLPEDAHERCTETTFVAVTQAMPFVTPRLVSRFHSRQDLVEALMTSCHIPYWMDGTPMTRFRDELHLDGGLTNFIPLPPGTACGIRICCFPSRLLSNGKLYEIGISPDSFDSWPYTLRQMLKW